MPINICIDFGLVLISEILKQYANNGLDLRSRFAYYRENNGKEIDLLILENGRVYTVEIKKSADPGRSALKDFSVLGSLPEERKARAARLPGTGHRSDAGIDSEFEFFFAFSAFF